MATIRESLRKLVEVAKPVPGDEQEFVAKHVIKTFDLQGKDAIHKDETPYEAILKNVAAVKSPSQRAEKPGENHGHNKPGESEAAYHVPESREQKLAKLSMMMEATINPKEQQLAESLKSLLAESFNLYLKAHHFHWNVMGPDFAQYHEFFGEFYEEVHGAVDMIAENIRVLGDLAPGNLGMPGVDTLTTPAVMIVTLLEDNRKVISQLKVAYSLAESVDRLGIANFLQDRLIAHEKHEWMMQAIAGIKGEEPMQEAKDVVGVKMHYHNPKTGEKFHEIHFSVPAAEKFRKQHEKAGFKLVKKAAHLGEEVEQIKEADVKSKPVMHKGKEIGETGIDTEADTGNGKWYAKHHKSKMNTVGFDSRKEAEAEVRAAHGIDEEAEQINENKPLLPKQKAIAADLLKKEMAARKQQRNDNRQAGTPKLSESEESKRIQNDKDRNERVATPRPHTPKTVEGMRHRLQVIKKQVVDKT